MARRRVAGSDLNSFLRTSADSLRSCGAQFCLIGGFAVALRAEPRLTRDVDFAVAVETDSAAEALIRALRHQGFEVVSLLEQKAVGRLATARLQHTAFQNPAFYLDLLFSSSGIEPESVAMAEDIEIAPGVTIPVARRAHLIAMKCLSVDERMRPRDAEDLLALLNATSTAEITEARNLFALIINRGFSRGRDLAAVLSDFEVRAREAR